MGGIKADSALPAVIIFFHGLNYSEEDYLWVITQFTAARGEDGDESV